MAIVRAASSGVTKEPSIIRNIALVSLIMALLASLSCEDDVLPTDTGGNQVLSTGFEPGIYSYTATGWLCPDGDTILTVTGLDTLCGERL